MPNPCATFQQVQESISAPWRRRFIRLYLFCSVSGLRPPVTSFNMHAKWNTLQQAQNPQDGVEVRGGCECSRLWMLFVISDDARGWITLCSNSEGGKKQPQSLIINTFCFLHTNMLSYTGHHHHSSKTRRRVGAHTQLFSAGDCSLQLCSFTRDFEEGSSGGLPVNKSVRGWNMTRNDQGLFCFIEQQQQDFTLSSSATTKLISADVLSTFLGCALIHSHSRGRFCRFGWSQISKLCKRSLKTKNLNIFS